MSKLKPKAKKKIKIKSKKKLKRKGWATNMKQFVLIVALLCIAGCSTMRQGVIDISAENVKNTETMKEIALNCVTVWPVQSGFIYGALDKKLSVETTEALKELDLLAEKTELTDYELGLFLGLKTRLLSSVIQVALEKYAPSIVEYLF